MTGRHENIHAEVESVSPADRKEHRIQVTSSTKEYHPIKLPHIPTAMRSASISGQQMSHRSGGALRVDRGHVFSEPALSPNHDQSTGGPTVSPSADAQLCSSCGQFKSKTAFHSNPIHGVAESRGLDESMADLPQAEVSRQFEQISNYLRRKRDELEAENAELAIAAWQQHRWLLAEKEAIRALKSDLRHVNKALEEMRTRLIAFGHSITELVDEQSATYQEFVSVCEAYRDIASQLQHLDD